MTFNHNTKKSIDTTVTLVASALVLWVLFAKRKEKPTQVVVGALVAALIAYAVTSQITKAALIAANKKLELEQQTEFLNEYGLTKAEYDQAAAVALKVYDALKGWWDDEAGTVEALNSLTSIGMVRAACAIYANRFGQSLKADVEDELWTNTALDDLVTENWS